MNYSVDWLPWAEQKLAKEYLAARSDEMAESFTKACFQADTVLSMDPLDGSESRDGDERILIIYPATFTFLIDESRFRVTVTNVHYIPIRRR